MLVLMLFQLGKIAVQPAPVHIVVEEHGHISAEVVAMLLSELQVAHWGKRTLEHKLVDNVLEERTFEAGRQ